jgi:hypothetical protein
VNHLSFSPPHGVMKNGWVNPTIGWVNPTIGWVNPTIVSK